MGYLASYISRVLPQTNIKIIDYGVENYSRDSWRHELESFHPDLVGLTILTLGYHQSMDLARQIRAYSRNVLMVGGGPHATVRPEECLYECDIVVRGEGEKTFYEILQNQPLNSINGISYRKGGRVVHNPVRDRIDNLDELPFPAHHLYRTHAYKQFPGWGIIGSRGCAYKCIFCASPKLWGRNIKLRGPQNIVDEIQYLNRDLGIRHIVFQDDAINLSHNRAMEICDEIIRRGLNKRVSFECQVRANKGCVSLELFRKMREANFVDLTFGIESGSNRVMKSLQKSLTVAEASRAVKLARQADIPTVTGFFMVGNWGESPLDIVRTWYFVARNKVDMKLTVCTPLPGTELETRVVEKGFLKDNIDWRRVNWVTPLGRTDKLPKWCISLFYYLTVLLVHLPSSFSRGRKEKAHGLVGNIMAYAANRLKVTRHWQPARKMGEIST